MMRAPLEELLPRAPGGRSELRAILLFLRRNWAFALLCGGVAAVLGGVVALALPARYAATASLIVDSQRPRAAAEQSSPAEDLGYIETQILTIGSDLILTPVVRELGLAEDPEFGRTRRGILRGLRALLPGSSEGVPPDTALQQLQERQAIVQMRRQFRARQVGTSSVLEISVTSREPVKAARIANLVASSFIADQRRLSMQITGQAEPRSTARMIGPATPPLEPSGPGAALIVVAAALLGLGGGFALTALREALEHRLRTAEEVEAATGVPCAAALPLLRASRAGRRAGRDESEAHVPLLLRQAGLLRPSRDGAGKAFAESLRLLGLILEEGRQDDRAIAIGLGAVASGAGRTTIAANLAALSVAEGRRTLLVDADVLEPGLSRAIAAADWSGADHRPLPAAADGLLRDPDGLLELLPLRLSEAGEALRGPTTWLADAVARGRDRYDVILVDLPLLGQAGDARALTAPLDTLVVVAAWRQVGGEEIVEGLRSSVREPGAKRLHALLNKVPSPRRA
jgi:succinoglycan biosynthesis transport protein ExoP